MKYQCINGWTKEKMIEHVKKEFKGKSINSNGNCVYRGPNGTKCAVGMFIPDNKYDEHMDDSGSNGSFSVIKRYNLKDFMPLKLMGNFQACHDESEPKDTLNDLINFIETNVE